MRHGVRLSVLTWVAVAVAVSLATVGTGAGSAAAGVPSRAMNRVSAPTAVPPRSTQIQVLKSVLQLMHSQYAEFANRTPGPQDIFDYGIGRLWLNGIDGAGTTVALIEGWDDPAIAQVIASFDSRYGLPDPEITTIFPAGPLPSTCPAGMVALGSYGSCDAWVGELRLDVEAVHLIAPYAKIVISATPADTEINADAAQQVAPPELMKALEEISSQHLANSVSISVQTGESTYSSREEILAQNPGELAAAAAGIPVFNSTGNCGVVQNLAVANSQCGTVTATADTAAWDDSPWVTAVGGSVPNLDTTNGQRLGPDPLWHQGIFSGGAGFSSVFSRPSYQDGVAHITKSPMRSVPDITMDGQDGTSESAPLLNGVMALATQMNHGNVGPINPALYNVLGPAGLKDGIADVVEGNNSTAAVPGFAAKKGFDVASGWGTLFAPRFVPALVAAAQASHDQASYRHQAHAQLVALKHAVQLSPSSVGPDGKSYLFAGGFLPDYPVVLSIGGQQVATLTANSLGDVTYTIDTASLGLGAGNQPVSLQSMLITKTAQLDVK